MRNMVMKSEGFTNKDSINSRNGEALQDSTGEIIVRAAAMMEVDDEDGEGKKTVTVLVTPDNHYFTAISATVYDVMPDVIAIIDEEEAPVTVRIDSRTSKSGRDFLTLTIL